MKPTANRSNHVRVSRLVALFTMLIVISTDALGDVVPIRLREVGIDVQFPRRPVVLNLEPDSRGGYRFAGEPPIMPLKLSGEVRNKNKRRYGIFDVRILADIPDGGPRPVSFEDVDTIPIVPNRGRRWVHSIKGNEDVWLTPRYMGPAFEKISQRCRSRADRTRSLTFDERVTLTMRVRAGRKTRWGEFHAGGYPQTQTRTRQTTIPVRVTCPAEVVTAGRNIPWEEITRFEVTDIDLGIVQLNQPQCPRKVIVAVDFAATNSGLIKYRIRTDNGQRVDRSVRTEHSASMGWFARDNVDFTINEPADRKFMVELREVPGVSDWKTVSVRCNVENDGRGRGQLRMDAR